MKRIESRMFGFSIWMKAWLLLERDERKQAVAVLCVVILAALSSAGMVGSVMPFLSVLSDPDRITQVPQLAWLYQQFGFTSSYSFLIMLGVGSLVIIFVSSVIQILKTYSVARFTTMRVHSISYRLLAQYLRQPYEFFLNRHTGDMATNILAESGEVVSLFFRPAAELIASSLAVIAVVSVLIWIDPVVAVISFLVLGGVYAGTYLFSRTFITRIGRDRAKANSERFLIANEALGGIKDIKLLGREGAYVDRYMSPSTQMARSEVGVSVVSQIPRSVLEGIAFSGIILLCLVLLDPSQFQQGQALRDILPLLGVFALAGQRVMPELQKVYLSATQLRYGAAAVDRVYDGLFSASSAGDLPRDMPTAIGITRGFRLDAVSYGYPKAETAGLRGITLDVLAGEKIGIVGSTGAGKTTFADIILGLLRPQSGQLLVDGILVTDENLRSWQQSVGYVPQSIFLTDASISQNIALGVPIEEIDMARVRRSAEIAQLDGFICQELPEGYETRVGERGVRLSGGQRQRIGIARALYHRADLIVFDEATSALDNLTERDVMSAINTLPGEKTIVIIAHRLSTVKVCDRIVVLDKGQIVGLGTWHELMNTNPIFQKITQVGDHT